MQDSDFLAYEFAEEDFVKDYKKTAEILDELTLKTMKRMGEISSRT